MSIDTHSKFWSQHPNYAGGQDYDLPVKPPKMTIKNGNNETAKKDNEPLQNNVYENVKIDLPDADADTPDFCALDDAQVEAGAGPESPQANGLMNFLHGITKKQWLWAAGITAGVLILKNNNRS